MAVTGGENFNIGQYISKFFISETIESFET
jgi:hypothetical protein